MLYESSLRDLQMPQVLTSPPQFQFLNIKRRQVMKGVKVFDEYVEDLPNEVMKWLETFSYGKGFEILYVVQTLSSLGKIVLTIFYTWD